MPQGRAARRLGALAAPLSPARAPYYVRLPVSPGLESTFPAPGWYWVPEGHTNAVFLAADAVTAAVQLHHLNINQEAA